ncbi:MAG: lipopolysaccharide kinase InaA family protein, partial [Myxococcota bacterium]
RAARRRLLRDLGRWLRGIHDAGVYHDDWSAKNILAAEHDGCWSFFLLDLESVVPHKGLNRRRRMKNLGQICDAPANLTATDRMRCLIAYADGDREFTRGSFPRGVLTSARRRARRRAQAGGPAVAGVAQPDSGPVVGKALERRVEKSS